MSESAEQSALAALFLPIIKMAVREALAEREQEDGPDEAAWGREAVAKYLGCCVVTVDKLVKAKKIPSKKVGGARLFEPGLIREWMRAGDDA